MEISRRSFLSGAAIAGAAVVASDLTGCSSGETAAASSENAATTSENTAAAPEVEHNPASTEDVDIVVVGSGTAGTCATLRAAELGAKVVCLEKNENFGGTSVYAEGWCGVGSKLQQEQGIEVDPIDVVRDTIAYHHCGCSGQVVRAFVDNSGETIDWLVDNGVVIGTIAALGQSYQVWHMPAGENGLVHIGEVLPGLRENAIAAGAEFRSEAPMTGLVVDDNGAVTGVYAQIEGEEVQINAKAVILASGGWATNPEMFEDYTGIPFDQVVVWGMPGRDGDGIRAAIDAAGADTHHPETVMYHTGAIDGTNAFSDNPNFILLMQPTLHVNETGKRYFNEAMVTDFSCCGNALTTQAANYVIIDDAFIDLIENNGPWVPIPTIGALSGEPWKCRDDIVNCSGVVQANTIEELAEGLGLDPAILSETINTYNGYCESGVDEEFGKTPEMLFPLSTPPFYGAKVTPTLFTTVGGLRVAENMQVVNKQGAPIAGLFAAGGDAAGLYGANYDVDVCSGSQQGWAATSGRLCAENALA